MEKNYDYYNDIAERMWIDGKGSIEKDGELIGLFKATDRQPKTSRGKIIHTSFGTLVINTI